MSVSMAERIAADLRPRVCQFELSFGKRDHLRWESVLCLELAVAVVDRKAFGKIALCERDLEQLRPEIERLGYSVARTAVLATVAA